jgi:transposase
VFLAEDEAGLYLQATTAAVWAPVGQTPIVRVDPGRAQTHFYGALNLVTGQELALRSDVMNAQVSARYLELLLAAYPDRPMVLLWDRAPWHRGQPIQQVLTDNPRLEIIYFPAGSPELNPQEHVWKATRGTVSHNHLEPRLPKLADQFEQHLTTTTFTSSFLDRYGYTAIRPMFI